MSARDKKFKFDNDETVITVKPQLSNKKVKIVKLKSKKMSEVPEKEDVFKPGRLVINFAGEDEEYPGQFLTRFDPSIEVRIKFNKADQDRVAANTVLKLAFWSEESDDWVLFTADKHQFELKYNASGHGGVGIAHIKDWGDPQVAWGGGS